MTDTKHTPTPWISQGIEDEADSDDYGCSFFIGSNLGGLVGAALPQPNEIHNHDFSRVEANAAHIVKCVNMHDELVEALKAARDDYLSGFRFHEIPHETPYDEVLKKAGAL